MTKTTQTTYGSISLERGPILELLNKIETRKNERDKAWELWFRTVNRGEKIELLDDYEDASREHLEACHDIAFYIDQVLRVRGARG